ncbi:MAG TPA: FkbM family methyltransferase [Beijerinckiaceae bacterium]|nr:FkbM family methyltransferase [Beijerinckiaceae bacterium]
MNETAPFGTFAPTGIVRWVLERTRAMPDSWAGRRLVFVLRRIAVAALTGAPVDIETFRARMRLHPYNNISEKKVLFTPQFFDPDELTVLKGRLREGFTFIDGGSNIGAYALYVASIAGRSARILAIEPDPEIFDRLVYNIGLNPHGTIKAIACALADKPGELTLFLDPRNRGQSSVKFVGSQAKSIRVPAMTLLELLQRERLERVDAIKLDVEGAEDIILEPFFRDAPPALLPSLVIVDGSGRQGNLAAMLERNGYRLIAKTRMNLLFERT